MIFIHKQNGRFTMFPKKQNMSRICKMKYPKTKWDSAAEQDVRCKYNSSMYSFYFYFSIFFQNKLLFFKNEENRICPLDDLNIKTVKILQIDQRMLGNIKI